MLTKVEEMRLLAQCALGDDRRAFGLLVEAYQTQLRRFFLNLTLGDAALSDDLAQETFLKAYINIRSFKGLSSFGTWLYRIGYNEFYTAKRRTAELSGIDELPQPATTERSDAVEAALDVKAAMAALTSDERTVVTLFYIDDFPVKKIEKITGMKSSTIRSHLHRARDKMATLLRRDNNSQHNRLTT